MRPRTLQFVVPLLTGCTLLVLLFWHWQAFVRDGDGDDEALILPRAPVGARKDLSTKITIAYAVSITAIQGRKMLDHAAVLHRSIQLASQKSKKYDYQVVAFVHPDAIGCKSRMEKLGYDVQVRETPFNETSIRNSALREAQSNGCCGAKEYLKLYSYTLTEYPIVVHIDLDTIILKPMDDLFDLMLDTSFNRSRIPAMWLRSRDFPPRIDFMFTRDYNLVDPPSRQPHQIGVQGGFLVIRPNRTDFDRLIEIIMSGGRFMAGVGWGGRFRRYGGYYGDGTIQGLASYYYGEHAKNRSLELNRCNYNAMVDDPKNSLEVRENPKKKLQCRTLEAECEDCRKTQLDDIYSAHFTVCGKPQICPVPWNWWVPHMEENHELCMKLFRQWHLVRRSLEDEWQIKYPGYDPGLFNPTNATTQEEYLLNCTQGHCRQKGKYIPMTFPSLFNEYTVNVTIK